MEIKLWDWEAGQTMGSIQESGGEENVEGDSHDPHTPASTTTLLNHPATFAQTMHKTQQKTHK